MRAADELKALLRERPMTFTQVWAVGLCAVINTVDGFDILAAAFTGPAIAQEWGLGPTQLGLLFSSGLAGMVLGALGLSPLADHWGRRRTALLCLVMITTGMILSAAAPGLAWLIVTRLLTGAGVGGMMPTINTVAAEYANRRRHDLAVCLQSTGFPVGGALAAIVVYATSDESWRWAFATGGALSLVLLPLTILWLPESVDFLIARQPPRAHERLSTILAKLHLPPIAELPARDRPVRSAPTTAKLRRNMVLICASFFLMMFSFYFFTSWTPKLLTNYGLAVRLGVSGALFMTLGGVLGDLVFSVLVMHWPARRLGPLFMLLCFAAAAVFAFVPTRIDVLIPAALALGFLLFGSMASLYAIVPTVLPATLRATGTGVALGLGRTGAAVGPYAGGALIAMSLDKEVYLLLMAAPLIVCALLASAIRPEALEKPWSNPAQTGGT